ncbi:radical SAM protein [Thermodesulfatator autotrophicus]|uniref:FeMo cofactor biosynthesis protein NifB n=1 Tax=Thermodesulfatator autotrophicus TaxID=1795632 RepID=A0A177E9P2_9BACT|nr:radical SAM protein [Thermodesulfatator autotrophicus]OAG28446.1 nitrogenase molybdenum-iron cofactor biosynthesis protein [Thermodesulfatator autotrophicus]
MLRHPCFDHKAHRIVGRLHLPVAPKCNIKCAYCEREVGCVHESRPGVASRVISPEEVGFYVEKAISFIPQIEVIGVAGPGDALANEETFEALKQVKAKFPELKICLSTNGLALPESLPKMLGVGVEFVSVTVNFISPEVGAKLLRWVKAEHKLEGKDAASFLVSKQLEGINLASQAGLRVKVNTVLVPGVNDDEVTAIAREVAKAGASLMNIIPLIPLGEFRGYRAPTRKELNKARSKAAHYLPQFLACKRCRADAAGIPALGDLNVFNSKALCA